MPVPSAITDLSTTAASNSPAGSDNVFPDLDNYLRAQASFIALLRDGRGLSTETTVASTATCDIGGAPSMLVQITGTTTITSFGTNYLPRILRFAGALTLTHNATTLILPTGANITTAAGDMCLAVPVGTSGWRVLQYQRDAQAADFISFLQAGTGGVSRSVQSKLRESVSVFDFMTAAQVSDVKSFTGSVDVTAAIQAAIDTLGSTTGGTIYLPAGLYRTTGTINCTERSVTLMGDGADSTVIRAEHSTGAVVRFYRRFSGLRNIGLSAAGARASATNTTGFGVHFECEDVVDSTTIRMQSCFLDNVSVQLQPGTATYWVGPATQNAHMQNCYISANRGHGYVVDRGQLSGRVNLTVSPQGCMTIDTCTLSNNGGNGVACGNPAETIGTASLRVVVENCEVTGNASDATARFSYHQIYMIGTNHEVRASVVNGDSLSGGIYVAGRNIWLRNNRYLDVTEAVRVANRAALTTEGVNIEGLTVINGTLGSISPAVAVDSGASNVRILNWLSGSIGTLVTPNVPGIQIDYTPQVVWKTADEAVNNSAVLQDDDHLKWYLAANENIYFQCVIEHSSVNSTPDIQVAFTIPTGAAMRWGPVNGIKIDSADAVVVQTQTLVSGTAVTFGSISSRRQIVIEGTVENGSTAGYLQLQWAQAVATAGNTNVYGNASHMRVWRKY